MNLSSAPHDRSVFSCEILRVNQAFTSQLGLTAEELAHGALVEWIHPDDWPALEAVVLYLAKPFTPDQLRHEVHRTLLLAGS